MTDTGLPTYLNRGISLTHAELCTELGRELLSLCRSVTADGRLSPEELAALRQWLGDAENAAMPAVKHLRGVIAKVLADGKITPHEYQEVHRAVEAAMPFDERRQAVAARLAAAEEAAARAGGAEKREGTFSRIGTRPSLIVIAALIVALAVAVAWLRG